MSQIIYKKYIGVCGLFELMEPLRESETLTVRTTDIITGKEFDVEIKHDTELDLMEYRHYVAGRGIVKGMVSQETFDQEFERCEDCGTYHYRDDMEYIDGRGYVCDDCLADNYELCVDCSTYHYRDDMEYIGGLGYVCEDCLADNYELCVDCSTYHYRDDMEYIDGHGYVCDDCYERYGYGVIQGYHEGSYPSASNAVGIEWEIEASKNGNPIDCARVAIDTMQGLAHCEHDGSLSEDGFEIITNPIDLKELPDKMYLFERTAKKLSEMGCTSHNNGRCGLHLHFSRELFTDETLARITNFYSANEEFLTQVARRTVSQVEQWANVKKTTSESDAKEKMYDGDRYQAINTQNNATIEFRLGRGTLNYHSLQAWVDIHVQLVKMAKFMEPENVSLTDWLAGCNDITKQYIEVRTGKTI